MQDQIIRELAEKWINAYNEKDINSLMLLYSPNAEVSFFALTPARGLDEIRALWEQDFRALPDSKVIILKLVSDGSTVMDEWTWTGTNSGPIVMPDGKIIPPTGRTVTVRGMDAIELKGDRIMKHRVYFQEVLFMKQLGMLPDKG